MRKSDEINPIIRIRSHIHRILHESCLAHFYLLSILMAYTILSFRSSISEGIDLTASSTFLLSYHIAIRLSIISLFRGAVSSILLSFSNRSSTQTLLFISRIIFSAVFFPIHGIVESSLSSLSSMALARVLTHIHKIFIAAFHPIQSIFNRFLNTFFSSGFSNQKRVWETSVI